MIYGRAVIGHLLEDDDFDTIIAAKILGIPSQVDTSDGQDADHETIGIDQVVNAMAEGVDTDSNHLNECCNANENRVDNTVVHFECPLCMYWHQSSISEVHISWFQDKWPTEKQQLDKDETTKIIKFLDNENPFEVNSSTQYYLDICISAHGSGNVDMQHS